MFYLVNFYKSFIHRPLVAIVYMGTLVALVSVIFFEKNVSDFLGAKKAKKNNPYFYAVVPADINTSYIQRKLINLPGVEGVALMGKEQIGEQVKAILENTLENSGVEWDQDLSDLNYAGLKVALSPDLQMRSQNLIRNYLSRLAGDKDVTMGAVKKPFIEPTSVKTSISNTLLFVIPAVIVIFYIMTMFLLKNTLGRSSFLLETYQRKTKVFEKSLFFGQVPVLCLLLYAAFFKGTAGLAAMLVYLLGIILVLGAGSSKKNWI